MMIHDLPTELVEEILSRVPAISLTRLGSTCKRWNGLFKDRRFREKHFSKAAKESLILMLKKGRICTVSANLDVVPPSIEFSGSLALTDPHSISEQIDITQVYDCEGLLLCCTNDDRLVVWNPCLGETTWVQLKTAGNKEFSSFALGYQKNKTCHSYKLLRCLNKMDWYERPNSQFEIYEFCSNSWRLLNDVNPKCFINNKGVSLKGNTYWHAVDDYTSESFLLSFDFTTEKFKHLCLPAISIIKSFSVVGEEQLSLINQVPGLTKMEIWVTNKIDTEAALSWSKCFIGDLCNPRIWSTFLSGLLINVEKKVCLCCLLSNEFMIYNVTTGKDDKYYKEIPDIESLETTWLPFMCNYVPSLVQIQQDSSETK